jgi:hypothetical protein
MENQTNVGNKNTQQMGQNPVSQPVNSPEKPKTNWPLIGGIVLACFVVFGFGGYYLGRQSSNNTEPSDLPQSYSSPTATVSSPTPESSIQPTTPNKTADWDSYSNTLAGFSIKHPAGWRKVETENWIGFGPKEIGEDVLMGVSFYNKSEKTISQIKDEVGKQFSDRKQTDEAITFNGIPATKVVTTANQYADWYSVTIIVESGNMLYAIGNGAQTDTALNEMLLKRTGKSYSMSFEDFYTSFRLTK